MTYNELYKAVDNKEIVSAVDKNGKKRRLFIATNGSLCQMYPRRSRIGFKIYDVDNYVSFQGASAPKTEAEKLKKQYNVIAKYKKLASEATFTNSFIEDCKNLPDFDTWKKDLKADSFGTPCEPRPKGLYDFGITTGNGIDGKVISIERIGKQYRHYAERLKEAIKNQTEVHICSSTPFAGYEMTLSTAKKETGEFIGYLSLEYKGCANGYYYLLINDENFIGYDVD